VVATGCNTHARVATAEAVRSRRASRAPPGVLGGMSYRRCQPPRHVEAPEAVERLPRREDGGLKGQSTGGRAEQASNTARGTSEKRRTCGSRQPDGASSKSIVPPRLRERLRPVGPSGPRRPAPPSSFRVAHRSKPRARIASREGERMSGELERCASRESLASRSGERVPSECEAGEGHRAIWQRPLTRRATRATLSPFHGERERAACAAHPFTDR
jgi:hypothetical protein